MAEKRLAIVGSLFFCIFVVVLLVILYYPENSSEINIYEDDGATMVFIPMKPTIDNWDNTATPEPKSKFAEIGRAMEDLGASFLIIVAVLCIVTGLVCFTCACCCIA